MTNDIKYKSGNNYLFVSKENLMASKEKGMKKENELGK
jgi:hypothetical protein